MDIEVTRPVIEAMQRAASNAHPAEACGMLLGEGNRIVAFNIAANVHAQPETHFDIDPQALVDAHRAARQNGGLRVLGYFHSHPSGSCRPSATDQDEASGDGAIWAIAASGDVQFWRDDPGGFQPVQYEVIGSRN